MKPTDPAFPGPNDGNIPGEPGIDVRTYLAAKAMQAIASNGALLNQLGERVPPKNFPELLARVAVEYADALIAELSKDPAKPS